MIHVMRPLPREIWVACSGGLDSMAALDFLRRRHQVHVAYFDHQTSFGITSHAWLANYCQQHDLDFVSARLQVDRPAKESQEEFWRNQRLAWLHQLPGTVVSAHHLDDCVETYLFNCLHGKPYTIAYQNQNIVRPFLTTPKSQLVNWCKRYQVPWLEDPSNQDTKYMRNHIRHNLIPQALRVNPGLAKVVRKIVVASLNKPMEDISTSGNMAISGH